MKCLDATFFECTDFQKLSQIITNLTRESFAEREAEMRNHPWTQTEKDNALAKCRLRLRAGRVKNLFLCLHAVTDDSSRARDTTNEHLLQHVQKFPDDIRWVIDRTQFDELIATKKDSAPGPDGIPCGAHRCNAYKYLLEGGTVLEHCAESGTVFIPKTSDINDNGRIVESPDALRPLTHASAIANFSLLLFVEASIGTP